MLARPVKEAPHVQPKFNRAILPAGADYKGPEVVRPLTWCKVQKKMELVGEGIEKLMLKYERLYARLEKGASGASAHLSEDEDAEEKTATGAEGEESKTENLHNKIGPAATMTEAQAQKKTKAQIEDDASSSNFYGILRLEHLTYQANEDDINRAYKKLILKYHPDKIRGGVTEADKEVWLTIVKAYETLLDKDKRRKFDSTLAFDDKIPQAGDWKTDAEFYTVFGDVFRRNSMWANKLPVPQLGDEKDSIEYAQNFYKYWDNFDSWRQFCQFDEHDTENCQDRWQKRHMEKENQKLRKEHEKKEYARLRKLYAIAYDNDPRIKQAMLLAQQELENKKNQKKAHKAKNAQAKAVMQKAVVQEKTVDASEKAEQEKAEKERKKQIGIKYRAACKELIALCVAKMPGTNYDRFYVESIQPRCRTIDRIEPIMEFLNTQEVGCAAQFQEFMDMHFMSEAEKAKYLAEKK